MRRRVEINDQLISDDSDDSDDSLDHPGIESLLHLLGRESAYATRSRSRLHDAPPRLSANFADSRLRHSVHRLLLDPDSKGVVGCDGGRGGESGSNFDGGHKAARMPLCFPFNSCTSGAAAAAGPDSDPANDAAEAARAGASRISVATVSLNRCLDFGVRQRYHLAHQRLPNASRVVLKGRSYFFCGLFSDPGDVFMCAAQGTNSPIRLFDTRDGNFRPIKSVIARDVGWSVLDLSLSPTGHHLVYSSWSHCLQLVGIHSDLHEPLSLLNAGDADEGAYSRGMFCHRWSSCGDLLIVGCNGGSLCLYDLTMRRPMWYRAKHHNDVNTVCWADGGRGSNLLLSSGDDGIIKLWDLRCLRTTPSAPPAATFSGHQCGVVYLDSRQDGRHFLSNSKDQTIKLWDLRRPASADFMVTCRRTVDSNQFDYRYQSVPHFDSTPLPGDPSLATLTGHVVSRTLLRARFSPQATTGQRYVYAGSANGDLLIWDCLTGRLLRRLPGAHGNAPVRDVSWHPFDSQRLLSAGWDARVRCSYYQAPKDEGA